LRPPWRRRPARERACPSAADRARFVSSVTNRKGNMPAWDDVLSPDDIEAPWAYVIAGKPED